MKGLFVTGTDTGAGKTILAGALAAAMRASGGQVAAHKPVLTGIEDPVGAWPPDHELLGLAAGEDPERVAPRRYGPAVSPHLAAALAGETLDPVQLIASAKAAARRASTTIVEGVGGLMVPLADGFTVRDLALELGLSVLIAARPGLGTINHSLLTLAAARGAGLDVRAVVLTPWPQAPSAMERSNRETIASLGEIEVAVLPRVAEPSAEALARAGAQLPWRAWLS
jgi:dethiobiotin synthetase